MAESIFRGKKELYKFSIKDAFVDSRLGTRFSHKMKRS